MAVAKIDKSTTIRMRVFTGAAADGRETYANRSITSINPELSDEDAMDIGTATAALLADPLHNVIREDTAELAEH